MNQEISIDPPPVPEGEKSLPPVFASPSIALAAWATDALYAVFVIATLAISCLTDVEEFGKGLFLFVLNLIALWAWATIKTFIYARVNPRYL